jgi:hypothetical protein
VYAGGHQVFHRPLSGSVFEGYTNHTGRDSHGDVLGIDGLGHVGIDGLLFRRRPRKRLPGLSRM